ncbi:MULTISPECIES: ABC transporter ATP-binding protein [unclassified Streptomyces]|uniref:ABC transporter ATP-binding protein n=1 Tax=unclassified Streptomyces TaxID=2593676 RepID=UPI0019086214|nr:MULTISPECIES: ABC transporter ATP-binding protein [unclassified Streptomyces]MCU4749371.1 ABC transporter ATP-binding protein/permease [Streptomyces sp. G-5]QQN77098.1 ABC transporter ATP-binding protein [Streptomyces sp. XC 2026]
MSATAPAPAAPAAKRSVVRSLLRLWPYVRPVRVRVFGAAAVAIAAATLGLTMPLILKWIVDGPVADGDTTGVWLGGTVLLVVGLIEALLFGLRRWLVARPLTRVEAALRADLYQHVQRLPVSFHDRWATGQLLSRGTGDLQLLRMWLAFGLTFLIVNTATIVIGCVILLSQQWTLGLVLMAPVPVLIILCMVFETKYSVVARRAQDQMGDLTTLVEESILGIRVIKGFGRHRSQAQAFQALSQRLVDTEIRKAKLLAWIWTFIMTLPELFMGAILIIGVLQVADGGLTAGTLVAFMATAMALRWPVESIGFLLAMTNDTAAATDRFFEVMDVEVPPERAREPQPDQGGTDEGIRFERVVFRFPDAPPDAPAVLDGIDLHIRPGETMALVGGTGSGKTALTALVPRLHEVTSGRITLDGTDVATLPLREVRERVAVAFEEPTLFSASVRENILMGSPEEGGDTPDAELERALGISQAGGFVGALPQGADTEVGEQGLSLSGGQRQRLALARAVVGRPRFLVLDDPLSALDVHTEAKVEAALREVLATTTALVVAHRPSTVQLADRVALLSGGRITAVGTHTELLRDNAEYRLLMTGTAHSGPSEPEEVTVR